MMKKTFRELHREVWEWMEKNFGASTRDYPGFVDKRAPASYCFACEEAIRWSKRISLMRVKKILLEIGKSPEVIKNFIELNSDVMANYFHFGYCRFCPISGCRKEFRELIKITQEGGDATEERKQRWVALCQILKNKTWLESGEEVIYHSFMALFLHNAYFLIFPLDPEDIQIKKLWEDWVDTYTEDPNNFD
jgi:hypothetical protein